MSTTASMKIDYITKVVVFGLVDCAQCTSVVEILEKRKFKYQYYDANGNYARNVLVLYPGMTVPVIQVNDLLFDYDNFVKIIDFFDNRVSTLREFLRSGTTTVKFIKSDGSVRILNGTLDFSLIPEDKIPASSPKKVSDETSDPYLIKVFDLDANSWRSIRGERLVSAE